MVGWVDGVVQYYGIATTTVFFYEYFAMLPDEVGHQMWSDLAISKLTPFV